MSKLLRQSLPLALTLVCLTVYAEKAEHHRYQYPTDGPVPKGLVLKVLGKVAVRSPQFLTPILTMQAGMSEREAQELTAYLAKLHREHMAERQASVNRAVCDNAPFVSTDAEVYELFDLADDIRFAVDSQYYSTAVADLTSEQFKALAVLIDDARDSISVNVVDHAVVYERSSEGTAINDLAQFCAQR